MAIECKDYYQILGVPRSAGDEEVRMAFRSLARMYHPDKAGNNRAAEDRFKEINEAYEVLGDASRRRRYDDFLGAWIAGPGIDAAWQRFTRTEEAASSPGREHYQFDGAGFSQFFQELFGDRRGNARPRDYAPADEEEDPLKRRGDDLESDIWVSLEEVASGAIRPITMKRAVKCPACQGLGQYNARTCERCAGKGSLLREETCKVKIPRGVQEGAFLRMPGRGEAGLANGSPGDLYLKVHYTRHPEFRVLNGQLQYDVEVAPWEAVLGASVTVATLDGGATIRIPEGTRSGTKLRLKGRGLPSVQGDLGDLIVNVVIQVPATPPVRHRERQLWEELARESTFQPRDNSGKRVE